MVSVGCVDPIERAAMSLRDILRDLEIVIGIVSCEPGVGKVVCVREGGVQMYAHNDCDKRDLERMKSFQKIHEEISRVIFPKFSPRHKRSCAAAASLSG